MVLALKGRAQLHLAQAFGRELANRLRHGATWQAVVPLPLAFEQQRARGFNQSLELARPLARSLGSRSWSISCCARARRRRNTCSRERIDGATCAARSPRSPRRARLSTAPISCSSTTSSRAVLMLDAASAALKSAGAARVVGSGRRAHALSGGGIARHEVGVFNIVLVAPDTAQNTGNVIRLAANTGARLHLVRPAGLQPRRQTTAARRPRLSRVRARPSVHPTRMQHCCKWRRPTHNACLCSRTRGERLLGQIAFRASDWLVFGPETSGLPPPALRDRFVPAQRVRLPMRPKATAASICRTRSRWWSSRRAPVRLRRRQAECCRPALAPP